MGVKEFAAKVRMASPNLLRALNPRHNPTQGTLNRLLEPFRLKLSLAPIDEPKAPRRVAQSRMWKTTMKSEIDGAALLRRS